MIAIYPGSFNPFHQGHLEVLKKGLALFEKVYVVVTKNILKEQESNFEQRVETLKQMINGLEGCEVLINENKLSAELAKELKASYMIRGVRDAKDFNYELELSDANKYLNKELETIIFIADSESREISSSRIKEIERYKKGE
ncbi:phosphopantetheine adenylyltransferase [Spiroplasma chinense]|uniref:Phosphopantetheine adenylyltransferase n=1 Tax=Spiroplasma chinense TaxID=216932 RepID=A0A5B9Y5M4_9MOLU|nr:pantetheine-phosphate adenylyltransferase [Spiroplasma chinense]QEH62250.1 phosphopantetheine adenylyltransferase [Spiroplasma chinense]